MQRDSCHRRPDGVLRHRGRVGRSRGSIRAAGNKNAALPIVAACLLTDEPVTLTNVPAITDVETMLDLVADLGVDVERLGGGEVRITVAGIVASSSSTRSSAAASARPSCFAGPLLARHGRGDRPAAGRRRDRTAPARHAHPRAHARSAPTSAPRSVYRMRADGLKGAQVFLDEASVTGTENVVMAAVLARARR